MTTMKSAFVGTLAKRPTTSALNIMLGLAISLICFSNFILHTKISLEKYPAFFPMKVHVRPAAVRLPTPIFVLGMPKVGTTSIHRMFICAGIKSSHYCCCGSNRTHTHCRDGRSFSDCIRDNLKNNRSILEGCGRYDVYAQIDGEYRNKIYLPQHYSLEAIHKYAPNSTFILNLRPASDWVNSISNWFGLGGRFLRQFKIDHRKTNRTRALEEIYANHTTLIRKFVDSHPSHHLVEVNIADPLAGRKMADAFGLDEDCWGKHNANRRKKNGS